MISGWNLCRVENLGLCQADVASLQDWLRAEFDIFSNRLVPHHQWFQIHIVELLLSISLEGLNVRWGPVQFGHPGQGTLKEVLVDILGVKLVDPLPHEQGLLKEKRADILHVLLPLKLFLLVLDHLEAHHLSDQDYDLPDLPVNDLDPPESQLCVNLIRLGRLHVQESLLVRLRTNQGLQLFWGYADSW